MEEFTAGTGLSRSQLAAIVGVAVLAVSSVCISWAAGRSDHWLAVNRGTAIPIRHKGEVFRDCPTCR